MILPGKLECAWADQWPQLKSKGRWARHPHKSVSMKWRESDPYFCSSSWAALWRLYIATAGKGLFLNTCTYIRYSATSLVRSLSFCQRLCHSSFYGLFWPRSHRTFVGCQLSVQQVPIWTWEVLQVGSYLSRGLRAGHFLREIPPSCALESNMTWLLGVVHPRNGKVPTLFLFVQGGVLPLHVHFQNIAPWRQTIYSFISGFLFSVRCKEWRWERAWVWLFGRHGLGDLNGRGAIQLFCSSLRNITFFSHKHILSKFV